MSFRDGQRVCYQRESGKLETSDRGTIRANEPGTHLPWRVEWDNGIACDDIGDDGRGTLPEGRVVALGRMLLQADTAKVT